MAVDIVASEGVFTPPDERIVMKKIFDALCTSIDATDDPSVASIMGVALYILPAARVTMGGEIAPCVRVDVVLPAIALASFRRRRRFIADATAAIVAHSADSTIAPRVVVRIVHCVDGGWGVGGRAYTNDDIDEGPE